MGRQPESNALPAYSSPGASRSFQTRAIADQAYWSSKHEVGHAGRQIAGGSGEEDDDVLIIDTEEEMVTDNSLYIDNDEDDIGDCDSKDRTKSFPYDAPNQTEGLTNQDILKMQDKEMVLNVEQRSSEELVGDISNTSNEADAHHKLLFDVPAPPLDLESRRTNHIPMSSAESRIGDQDRESLGLFSTGEANLPMTSGPIPSISYHQRKTPRTHFNDLINLAQVDKPSSSRNSVTDDMHKVPAVFSEEKSENCGKSYSASTSRYDPEQPLHKKIKIEKDCDNAIMASHPNNADISTEDDESTAAVSTTSTRFRTNWDSSAVGLKETSISVGSQKHDDTYIPTNSVNHTRNVSQAVNKAVNRATSAMSTQMTSLIQSLVTQLSEKLLSVNGDVDGDVAFGHYVTCELKKMNEELKTEVKFSIQKIVYNSCKCTLQQRLRSDGDCDSENNEAKE